MSENDYIAEYIKEKHRGLLGVDFALWRISRMAMDFVWGFSDVMGSIPADQMVKILEAFQDENETETTYKDHDNIGHDAMGADRTGGQNL